MLGEKNRERGLPAWTWFRGMFSPHLFKCPLDERALALTSPQIHSKIMHFGPARTTDGSSWISVSDLD